MPDINQQIDADGTAEPAGGAFSPLPAGQGGSDSLGASIAGAAPISAEDAIAETEKMMNDSSEPLDIETPEISGQFQQTAEQGNGFDLAQSQRADLNGSAYKDTDEGEELHTRPNEYNDASLSFQQEEDREPLLDNQAGDSPKDMDIDALGGAEPEEQHAGQAQEEDAQEAIDINSTILPEYKKEEAWQGEESAETAQERAGKSASPLPEQKIEGAAFEQADGAEHFTSDEEAMIHAMPGPGGNLQGFAFPVKPINESLSSKKISKKFIGIACLFILIAAGVYGYYFYVYVPSQQRKIVEEQERKLEEVKRLASEQKEEEGQKSEIAEEDTVPKKDGHIEVKMTLENQIGEIVGNAKVSISSEELTEEQSKALKILGIAVEYSDNTDDLTKSELLAQQAISGFYTISSQKKEFDTPIRITLGFNEYILDSFGVEKEQLRIGFIDKSVLDELEDDDTLKWYLYSSSKLTEEGADLEVSVTKVHDSYYGIVPLDVNDRVAGILSERKNQTMIVDFPESIDSDKDGLTDEEEKIFGTNSQLVDSDGDGHDDLVEIKGLYDPSKGSGARLFDNEYFNNYRNVEFGYSMVYPANWLVRSLDSKSTKDIIFTSNTGEFFEVVSDKNPIRLTSLQWYLLKSGIESETELDDLRDKIEEIKINNGLTAALSPDKFKAYIAYKDKIFIFSYSPGSSKELNFKATYSFVYDNFEIINLDVNEIARLDSLEKGMDSVIVNKSAETEQKNNGNKDSEEEGESGAPDEGAEEGDGHVVAQGETAQEASGDGYGESGEIDDGEEKTSALIAKDSIITAQDIAGAGLTADQYTASLVDGNYKIEGLPVQEFKGSIPDMLSVNIDIETEDVRNSSLVYENAISLNKLLSATVNGIELSAVDVLGADIGEDAVIVDVENVAVGTGSPAKKLIIKYNFAVLTFHYTLDIEEEVLILAKSSLSKIDAYRAQQSGESGSAE